MLIRIFEELEKLLQSFDIGGEQSRQFSEEIELLRRVIGCPGPVEDEFDEIDRRDYLVKKLRILAVQAEDIKVSLPKLPVSKWLDGTFRDATKDIYFMECDLAGLLRFIADVGVNCDD